MKRTCVFLQEPELKQLAKRAKREDVSVAELIRRAIREFNERDKERK